MKRAALYLRVSTNGQTVENQSRELRAVAERNGWEIMSTFTDEGISGAKGREKRPGYRALWQAVSRKDVDVVMVWHVDRLGRNLRELLSFFQETQDKGVTLYLHQQGIDTSTLMGKTMFQMMGVFAEFERGLITERINAGLARTVAAGTKLGRKRLEEVNPVKNTAVEEALIASGFKSTRKIGRALGVGSGTVERIKARMMKEGSSVSPSVEEGNK
jgi:DNA invertase Pin-like site-specific DNA recombinase